MYCDSCIIVKIYFPEANSGKVAIILGKTDFFHSSELVISEFKSAIARKFREGIIDRTEAKKIIEYFSADISDGKGQLLPVSREILGIAGEIILVLSPEVPLRTLDAVHLATCIEFSLGPLFSTDVLMLKASKKLGIKTISL